jgi:hypothetical protein
MHQPAAAVGEAMVDHLYVEREKGEERKRRGKKTGLRD